MRNLSRRVEAMGVTFSISHAIQNIVRVGDKKSFIIVPRWKTKGNGLAVLTMKFMKLEKPKLNHLR